MFRPLAGPGGGRELRRVRLRAIAKCSFRLKSREVIAARVGLTRALEVPKERNAKAQGENPGIRIKKALALKGRVSPHYMSRPFRALACGRFTRGFAPLSLS